MLLQLQFLFLYSLTLVRILLSFLTEIFRVPLFVIGIIYDNFSLISVSLSLSFFFSRNWESELLKDYSNFGATRSQKHYRIEDKIKKPRKCHDLTIPFAGRGICWNRYVGIKWSLVKFFFQKLALTNCRTIAEMLLRLSLYRTALRNLDEWNEKSSVRVQWSR